jgi:hypothetical protein
MSSDYKKYLVRQMGLNESSYPPKSPKEEEDPTQGTEDQSSNLQNLSPTAKATPVIGFAVRGAPSGGLPSGRELAPSKLGGYTKVQLEKPNSDVIDKTPKTGVIDNSEPVAPEGSIPPIPSEPHPHQVQKNTDNPSDIPTNSATQSGIDVTVNENMYVRERLKKMGINEKKWNAFMNSHKTKS